MTLRDRIRERAYHLWSNGSGQGDDNHYGLNERAVGTAGGSWLFALQRRAESLRAGTGPGYTLPDNGKRVFDRRDGVARDLLREKLWLLVVDRRCQHRHVDPAIREGREFDVVELDAPDHGASAGARVGHLAPAAAGATLPVRLLRP